MFNRYRGEMNGHQSMELYHKFVEIFEKELGLKIQHFTPQKCSLMGLNVSQGFLVGEQVYIIPSITNKWVVKNGSFEQAVENMKDIFEIIRRAWRMR